MNYQQYLSATARLLQKNRRAGAHYTQVCGQRFFVGENVFSPKFFKDTEIFARHLKIHPGESMLEIGPGCGAVGLTKCRLGLGRYTAIDFNHGAVNTTRKNVKNMGLDAICDIRQGDVFSALGPHERFDVIFWNVPFGLISGRELKPLDMAVFDPDYASIKKYISQGHSFLKPGGRLMLGFSTTLGRPKLLSAICRQNHLRPKLVYRVKSSEIFPVFFELYQLAKTVLPIDEHSPPS